MQQRLRKQSFQHVAIVTDRMSKSDRRWSNKKSGWVVSLTIMGLKYNLHFAGHRCVGDSRLQLIGHAEGIWWAQFKPSNNFKKRNKKKPNWFTIWKVMSAKWEFSNCKSRFDQKHDNISNLCHRLGINSSYEPCLTSVCPVWKTAGTGERRRAINLINAQSNRGQLRMIHPPEEDRIQRQCQQTNCHWRVIHHYHFSLQSI